MASSEQQEQKPGDLILPIPSKCQGRDAEYKTLLNAYRRVVGHKEAPSTAGTAASSRGAADGGNDDRPGRSEIVLVRGRAGTGKSFLVSRLRDEMWDHRQYGAPVGFYADGQFQRGEKGKMKDLGQPYSAITDAFTSLVEEICDSSSYDVLNDFRAAIDSSLGDNERELIMNIVPNLHQIIGMPASPTSSDPAAGKSKPLLASDSSKGLHYVFRSFVSALVACCHRHRGPVVLSLEDAECIDDASLALITALANDSSSLGLLIVLAVRDEEDSVGIAAEAEAVDGAEGAEAEKKNGGGDDIGGSSSSSSSNCPRHPLLAALRDIRDGVESFPVTEILVEDFNVKSLTSLVASMLKMGPEDDRAGSLAAILHGKTLGNPLYSVQLLRALLSQELLTYSFTTFRWMWDEERIQVETNVTDNVVDLVLRNKVEKFGKDVQFVLMIASCLNSTIDTEVLATIVTTVGRKVAEGGDKCQRHYPAVPPTEETVERALDEAVNEGLMERVSARKCGTRVKFSHERIKQSCHQMIPDDDAAGAGAELHYHLGETLRAMKDSGEARSWMLFSAVEHLNKGHRGGKGHNDAEFLSDLVKLNLEAGERGVALSAFVPAAGYLKAGIDLMKGVDEGCWSGDNYDLTLKLHTELASTMYCCGRLDESKVVSTEVLANARTLPEKLRVYLNLIALLKAQGKLEESVNVGIDFLSQLGETCFTSTQPHKLKVMYQSYKTKKMLKSYDDEALLALPDCRDDYKGMAVYVLGMLFGPMVHLQHTNALDLLRLRSVKLTVKYGVADASALAYAYYGSHLISLPGKKFDIASGYKFGKLALQLLDRLGSTELKSRTILLSNFMIVHWKEPLAKTLDRLMEGYTVGMVNGDIEMAFTNAGIYQQHFYYCGLPLPAGEQDIRDYCRQMEEYKQTKELRTYKPLWQCMLNLMGRSDHPVRMTGDAMVQEEFEKGKIGVAVMQSYQMQLAYYFEDVGLAETLMDKLRPQSKGFTAPFFQIVRRFFFALISVRLAKESGSSMEKRKHVKKAKEDMEWMKARVDQGAINCLHKYLLLQAELDSLGAGKNKDVKQTYESAISTSRRNGYRQDEALANELAGKHFLARDDVFWATHYITRAHQLYMEWGAMAKANQLQVQHTTLLSNADGPQEQRLSGKSFMGRRRFSQRLSDSHKSIASFTSSISLDNMDD